MGVAQFIWLSVLNPCGREHVSEWVWDLASHFGCWQKQAPCGPCGSAQVMVPVTSKAPEGMLECSLGPTVHGQQCVISSVVPLPSASEGKGSVWQPFLGTRTQWILNSCPESKKNEVAQTLEGYWRRRILLSDGNGSQQTWELEKGRDGQVILPQSLPVSGWLFLQVQPSLFRSPAIPLKSSRLSPVKPLLSLYQLNLGSL